MFAAISLTCMGRSIYTGIKTNNKKADLLLQIDNRNNLQFIEKIPADNFKYVQINSYIKLRDPSTNLTDIYNKKEVVSFALYDGPYDMRNLPYYHNPEENGTVVITKHLEYGDAVKILKTNYKFDLMKLANNHNMVELTIREPKLLYAFNDDKKITEYSNSPYLLAKTVSIKHLWISPLWLFTIGMIFGFLVEN